MAISGRAALIALIGALVVPFTGRWGVAAIGGLLLLGILADLLLAGSVRSLVVQRGGDTRVRLGETATVTLTLANPGRRRVRGRLRDAWPPSAGASPRDQALDLPPGERRRITTSLTPTRRGDRAADRVTIRAYGPLGLAARQGAHRAPWTLRALPPFHSRRHLPGRLARLRELDGTNRAMIRGQGSEFDSLREYVAGDDVRSIDWRATARRETVVVRTWRPERDRHILIVLDTGRTSAGRVGTSPLTDVVGESTLGDDGWPRLDWSMDAALLLGALAARAGDRVDLLAYDRQVRARLEGRARGDLLPGMVQAMATLEPELIESDARGMVSAVLSGTRRRSLVVLLTDLNTAALREGLLPTLGALTAKHLVLVAAVADPRVDELAAGRGDAARVYEAAAAERTRGQRRRVTEELRRHGVEVVDATPEHFAPALADKYLELKAAGRL
ncbi:MAG: DUF58 domain-containing protein [Streptosporangiales bacterium]|nr:DUF58 domain-containing protein [Streptosporangiales bacterium]